MYADNVKLEGKGMSYGEIECKNVDDYVEKSSELDDILLALQSASRQVDDFKELIDYARGQELEGVKGTL